MVSKLKMQAPKIGSVEEFQGEERYAIILSTVRGSGNCSPSTSNNLGFLACPRRLNVAITRARAILIIVGDPFTLSADIYWKNVIKYCCSIKSYIGCSLDGLFKNENSKEETVSEVIVLFLMYCSLLLSLRRPTFCGEKIVGSAEINIKG